MNHLCATARKVLRMQISPSPRHVRSDLRFVDTTDADFEVAPVIVVAIVFPHARRASSGSLPFSCSIFQPFFVLLECSSGSETMAFQTMGRHGVRFVRDTQYHSSYAFFLLLRTLVPSIPMMK